MKSRNQILQFSLLIILLSGCNSGGSNQINNSPLNQTKQSQSNVESSPTSDPVIYDAAYLKSVIWEPLVAADKADPGSSDGVGVNSSFFSLLPAERSQPSVGFLTNIASEATSTGIPLYGYDPYSWQGCSEWEDYDFKADDPNTGPMFAIPNNDMQLSVTPIYAGDSRLTNSTDSPLTLTSSQFSYSQAVTSSTATTLGWKLGTTISSLSKVDLVFASEEIDISVSAEVNGATTDTLSKTDTFTYTSASQNILVPPHTIAIVSATLQLGSASGTYTTYTPLNPNGVINWTTTVRCPDSANSNAIWPIDLKQAYKLAPDAFRNIAGIVESSNNVYLSGLGKYTVQHAASFQIKVEFVPVDGEQTSQLSLQGAKQNKIITYMVPAVIAPKK